MKTFQQFNEEVTARGVGAGIRQGINRGVSATYNFGKGFFTGKAGSKPGSAQHRGAQLRRAGDRAADYGMKTAVQNQKRRQDNLTGFVKGLVTGK
ncbi:hypothetical protein [Synechococcus phage S-8S53]|nr:hypothetical protein [Synechococcus phage S-8S53]